MVWKKFLALQKKNQSAEKKFFESQRKKFKLLGKITKAKKKLVNITTTKQV